jgi:hypothetical protein
VIPEPKAPASKKRSKTANIERAVNGLTVGAFNMVGLFTQHRHWMKDAEDVVPITDPINAYIDGLPAKTQKALEERIIPISLAGGLLEVLIPDIIMEMRIRANHRHIARSQAEGHARGYDIPTQESTGDPATFGSQPGNGRGPSPADGDDLSRPPRLPGVPF